MIVFRSLVFNALFLVYHLALVLALTSLLPFPRRWSQCVARLWKITRASCRERV